MTKSEYQELVEFIAPRFDRIDNRLDGIDERFAVVDKRFDGIDERFAAVDERFDAIVERFDATDERLRRVEILGEENRHQIQIVAETVAETVSNDKFETFRSEVAAGFRGPWRTATGFPSGVGSAGDAPGGRL